MEWVETTGRTVEDAKDAALDQLGVDERDAEFQILEEPRAGLFGRLRGEARVRARVRPVAPRPKVERSGRRRRRERSARTAGTSAPASSSQPERAPTSDEVPAGDGDGSDGGAPPAQSGQARRRSRSRGGRGRGRGRSGASGREMAAGAGSTTEGSEMTKELTVDEQAAIMRTFLEGLVDAFELDGTIAEARVDDETIELRVDGEDLGLLIGPKGQTLQAIQELARTVVQRQASGTHHGRVRIDVAGYRQRRREALERFTRQVAADVLATGVARALEPMHPADRKVVHDVVNEIDGVQTTSEGEEPHRRVVILPAPPAEPS